MAKLRAKNEVLLLRLRCSLADTMAVTKGLVHQRVFDAPIRTPVPLFQLPIPFAHARIPSRIGCRSGRIAKEEFARAHRQHNNTVRGAIELHPVPEVRQRRTCQPAYVSLAFL